MALLLNGQICTLEVEDAAGNPVQPGALYGGICAAVEETELHKRKLSLGILTTTDRDIWTAVSIILHKIILTDDISEL